MTRASDELLRALDGLRKAAGRELDGEGQQAALQYIKVLFQLAGLDDEGAANVASEADVAFSPSLAEVRRLAERELSGNAFYLASEKLDALGALSKTIANSPVEKAPEEPAAIAHSEPESVAAEPPVADAGAEASLQGASFEELAAVSKTRVDEVAASLGIEGVHSHHGAPIFQSHEIAQDVELERRSSEPCSMPELIPPEIEPVASPPIAPVEAVSAREVAEAAHDLGSPAAAEAAHVPDYAAPHPETPAEVEAAPEVPAPEPSYEAPPAPAAEVEAAPEVPAPAPAYEAPPAPAAEVEAAPEVPAPSPVYEAPPAPAAEVEAAPEVPAPSPAYKAPPAPAAEVEAAPEVPAPSPAYEAPPAPAAEVEAAPEVPAPSPAYEAPPAPAAEVEAAPEVPAPAPAYKAPPAPPAEVEAAPEVAASAPVYEAPPAPAKKAGTGVKEEPAPKEPQKTFFSLWLDVVFGRRK